jgi:hypothetical protein
MHLRWRPSGAAIAVALLSGLLQACGGAGPTSPSTLATAVPTATTPAPTRKPTPPPDAAPVELQGRWNTTTTTGDDASLIIGETVYQITRGGTTGAGHLSVDGNVITFKEAKTCPDGVGTYTWAIVGGKLSFTPTGAPDTCPRIDVLLGTTFVRAAT